MKKFSTIAAFLVGGLSVMTSLALAAPGEAATAQAQAIARSSQCAFLADAPDKHEVVSGDTLWGIAGQFIRNPWCWPQVWGMNREEIRNPHWIYPGQIIYFDRANQRLRLANATGSSGMEGGVPTVKLSPRSRVQGLGTNAIPSIPASAIEPFLSQPLIVEPSVLERTPRIVSASESRVNLGQGETAYVRGDLDGGTSFQVFRPGVPLKDPDNGSVIGYEAAFVGTVKLVREPDDTERSDVHTFSVVNTKEEMSIGDRLLPIPPTPILSYVPHPPVDEVNARVVSVYGGVSVAGQNQIIAINRGREHGLDLGTVLSLERYGQVMNDRTDNNRKIKLPDVHYGNVFIFRVFGTISYGLVMQVTDFVKVGDVARSPQ
ncbi:LysM peptidoglycan-binding domain-containing protein [Undibacterium oligocarboniphilum]|uniref:LysM peptidoglycan-binding domain-containing protein n=1 Tax=Undibacterium oligocarboniphilum TaxID=666702 RepID=A0A850QBB2_9BURK|nr:LysM peptidoglycan-binding domain-containing protein [Undibacterium oligocarboniphilum]MBC3869273.1 LysM peptidoglycan-binding domain-containing protein [Undibacterium oligocarboniphilum]NVO77652.1 LysM peptidoglycan-binding domain-containing protein [Undibacterium oligocarboniphilum]